MRPFRALLLVVSLTACTSIPRETQRIFSEIKKSDLIKDAEEDPARAVSRILSMKREDPLFADPETVEILRRSVDSIDRTRRESLEKMDYTTALLGLRSISALSENSDAAKFVPLPVSGEASEPALLAARAFGDIEHAKYTSGFLRFLDALDSGYGDLPSLVRMTEYAIKQGNSSVLRQLIKKSESLGIAPAPEAVALAEKRHPVSEMVKGTVTILVNKGIKIENGIGLPDRVIGSGFFVDYGGYILTNYHVVSSEVDPKYEGYSRLFVRPYGMKDDKIPAKVVGWDKVFDLALLKTEVDPEFVFTFSGRQEFSPGERIYAIGSPIGLESTVSSGIVSAVNRRILQMGDAVQVDVLVNPGNSGGPLLDENGEVAGVVFAGIEQYQGLNFAIPVKWVSLVLPSLFEGGEMKHAYFGFSLREGKKGLEIEYIVPGSGPYEAGMLRGDRLLALNGKKILTMNEMHAYALSLMPGTLVALNLVSSEGEEKTKYVRLTNRPDYPLLDAVNRDSRLALFHPIFGMEVKRLPSAFYEENYVVESVVPGSLADETGLSENDPFTLQAWILDKEKRILIVQIFIKRKKSGFLESLIQLPAYLESDTFV